MQRPLGKNCPNNGLELRDLELKVNPIKSFLIGFGIALFQAYTILAGKKFPFSPLRYLLVASRF